MVNDEVGFWNRIAALSASTSLSAIQRRACLFEALRAAPLLPGIRGPRTIWNISVIQIGLSLESQWSRCVPHRSGIQKTRAGKLFSRKCETTKNLRSIFDKSIQNKLRFYTVRGLALK
jgi:hypothetical protein